MAQFSIRPARPEDCGTILELIRGIAEYEKMSDEVVATEETIRHAMFDEHVTRCLLAELDGKVIGYALYFYNYSTFIGTKGLYLEDLFLYPEYRKAGYGKRLIPRAVQDRRGGKLRPHGVVLPELEHPQPGVL